MIYIILLLAKILLYMNITNVNNNRLLVFFLSALVIFSIYGVILYRKDTKKKRRKLFSYYFVISLILLIDVLHYTYFNRLPTVNMLSQAGQVSAVTDTLKQIVNFKNMLMILDLPILIYLKRKDKISYINIENKFIPISIFLVLGLYVFGLNYTGKLMSVSNQELFSYHVKDIRSALGEDNLMEAAEDTDLEAFVEEARDRARLKDGNYTGLGKGKNLIVIQVESLQNFVIGKEYEGQEITPNLNKLIGEKGSIYFDNFYQSNGAGNTSDAEFVSHNSFHASMEEPAYTKYEENTFYGLPHLLKDQGYRTSAFHGFKKDFWNREKAYENQGFDQFIGLEDYNPTEKLEFGFSKIGFGLTDGEFFKQSIPYLEEMKNTGDPFYGFFVSLTSHAPYEMPDNLVKIELKPEHEGSLFGNYLQSINYTDRAIGAFIDDLKEKGLYEDTVIALYGDHFALNSESKENKKHMLEYLGKDYDLDEMMNIPLVIHVPGEEFNERVSKVGSHLDFYPTIQNIMGYDNEKGMVLGVDLLNFEGENVAIPQNYAVRGSFVTDNEMFKMSNDIVFENSYVYNKETQEELNPMRFRNIYDKVLVELTVSDYLLKNNSLEAIMKGEGIAELDDRNQLDLPKEIVEIKRTEEIDKLYEEGVRGFRLGLEGITDIGLTLKNQEHFYTVYEYLEKYDDIYMLVDIKDMEEYKIKSVLRGIKSSYPEVLDRLVIETKNLANTEGLNYIYAAGKDVGYNQISDIIKTYPSLEYIVINGSDIVEKDLKKLSKLEKRIFIEDGKIDSEAIYGTISK